MSVPGLGERYPVYPRDTREICDDAEAKFRVEVDVRSRISLRVDFKHQQIDNPSEYIHSF